MDSVDFDAQAVLDGIEASRRRPFEEIGLVASREAMRQARRLLSASMPPTGTEDIGIPGSGGSIPVRIYRPPDAGHDLPLPLVVYLHGGGWALGDVETGDAFCADLAIRLRIAVAAVDYRLAPEHPFPAAIEDCRAVLTWLAEHAAGLGLDADRIAIMGDSAGGNLVAVCTLIARNSGGPALRGQILLYPATDLTTTSGSYVRNARGYGLGASTMRWFRDLYLQGADAGDWRASPLAAPRLDGLPPALIVTCGFDPLADEGSAYADRLSAAGVTVHHVHYPRQIHGFALWGGVVRDAGTVSSQVANALAAWLLPVATAGPAQG